MNYPAAILGGLMIAYGLATVYLRVTRPGSFKKLAAMQRQWGEIPGMLLHCTFYSVVPILAGLVVLAKGLKGQPLF